MLQINKNQVVIGQKVVASKDLKLRYMGEGTMHWVNNKMFSDKIDKIIPKGTVLEIVVKKQIWTSLAVRFKTEDGYIFSTYWADVKAHLELGDFPNLGAGKVEYKLYYEGEPYNKKKFKDLGKVKASLMSAMGFHNKFQTVAQNYYDRCPEHEDYQVPYWFENYNPLNCEQFKKFELYEWSNRKKGNKVEFYFVGYYDELIKLLSVSAQFGSAARDVFKKTKEKEGYKAIVVYVPDEYRQDNTGNWYWTENLKESPVIKEALKDLKKMGVKGTMKTTKNGKTAVALKSNSDAIKLMKILPSNTYYVLNWLGDAVEARDETLIKQATLAKKLQKVLNTVI